jgi:hypothetical protein
LGIDFFDNFSNETIFLNKCNGLKLDIVVWVDLKNSERLYVMINNNMKLIWDNYIILLGNIWKSID